jgi:PAS domain S-box-containing protein
MLAYWDRDLTCRFANRAYETWFGVDPDQLVGTSLPDLLGPELFALNEPYVVAALAGRQQSFQRSIPGPDGVTRHSLANYQPDIVDGQVIGIIVTVTEITQLKQTEASLRSAVRSLEAEIRQRRSVETRLADTQQSLAVTLASIAAGFIATDRQGRISHMNAVSERLTGWSQRDADGKPLWEVFVREDRPASLAASNPVDVMREQGITVDDVHHVVAVSRSGARTSVEVKAALTHSDDGTARGVALVLRDMTQIQQAKVESNRLAAIVESSHDAIIGKTLDGRITSWNAAAQAMFGYTADEAIGQPIQMLIPEARQDEEMRILSGLARGVRLPEFETVRRTRDGRLLDVSITISPIRDAAGRVAGASKIVRDISPRKQAEGARKMAERLEAENRQIQEASRVKSLFLANMSHELRTPLNAIIGFADLIESGKVRPDSPKLPLFIGHIARSGRHLLQLINDVLDLAKVESGKFEFFPAAFDLPQLVAEVGGILHGGMERKGLRLDVDIDPRLTGLVLDAGRLKQVLYNYLSNATKFTPEGGRVVVCARPEGPHRFRLEVEDTGIGIAADQLPKLFSEFQQLDAGPDKRYQGTGLGLALTRRLIEAQGGWVGATSEPGRGSVFYLVLNRVHGQGDARSTSPSVTPPPRLLVVEDDPIVQARLIRALTDAGFGAEAAASPAHACELAKAMGFAGLTLGLHLPLPGSLGVLAGMRGDASSPAVPVLGLTASTDAGSAAAFAISDILSKPIREGEIAALLAGLQSPQGPPARVMVIDDDPLALDLMRDTLDALGLDPVCLTDGRRALQEIDQHRPQAIILDLLMPEFDGFAVLDALHRLPQWRATPVYIWTSLILTVDEYIRLARSAQSIVSKGGGNLATMLERLRDGYPVVRA